MAQTPRQRLGQPGAFGAELTKDPVEPGFALRREVEVAPSPIAGVELAVDETRAGRARHQPADRTLGHLKRPAERRDGAARPGERRCVDQEKQEVALGCDPVAAGDLLRPPLKGEKLNSQLGGGQVRALDFSLAHVSTVSLGVWDSCPIGRLSVSPGRGFGNHPQSLRYMPSPRPALCPYS